MFERFTDAARSVVKYAQEEARQLNHSYIGTEHLLLGILHQNSSNAFAALKKQQVNLEKLRTVINVIVGKGASEGSDYKPFSSRAKVVLELAVRESEATGSARLGIDHIMIGILKEGEGVGIQALLQLDVDLEQLLTETSKAFVAQSDPELVSTVNKSRAAKGSILENFGIDLTQKAREGRLDPVVDRKTEIERIVQVLTRRTKNNPVLLGDPGVGKTAVVEGLALNIAAGEVPQNMRHKRLFSLDLGQLVAGTRYRGDFEERLKKLTKELQERDDVLLFIDEIHTLVGAGGAEGSLDASNILKPLMSRGEIQLIGATTLDEYRKYIERDAALERRFQPIDIVEPNIEQTIKILQGLKLSYEAYHNVIITDAAIHAAVELSARYITDRFMPDKAIDLMDEAAARMRIKQYGTPEAQSDPELANAAAAAKGARKEKGARGTEGDQDDESAAEADRPRLIVDEDIIAEVLSMATGIPAPKVSESEGKRLLEMESQLHARVIGQDEAISALARAIRRSRAGLKDPKRPGGSFIFAGPTGVGKTELAKTLAEFLFGTEDALIRIDMSEFQERFTVSRLIGSAPGYVGYGEGGQLTNLVRRKPYSVILFDEIEKAHPDIFNILLQVLDDGRLTDSQGRVVDFKNTIIIMTTNIGSRRITQSYTTGFAIDDDTDLSYIKMKGTVNNELKNNFRPEFINRLDDVIVFKQLNAQEVGQIADLMIADLQQRLLAKDIQLKITPSARAWIAEKGFDRLLGARPLKRVVQHEVEDLIAEKVLFNEITPGQKVTLDRDKKADNLTLKIPQLSTLPNTE